MSSPRICKRHTAYLRLHISTMFKAASILHTTTTTRGCGLLKSSSLRSSNKSRLCPSLKSTYQNIYPAMAHHAWNPECKVYVGGLKEEANKYDLEDAFSKIGKVVNVWVARRPPGFGFVEMEDPRDALDCVKELDGIKICGGRVKIEMSKPSRGRGGRDGSRDRRDYRRSRSRSRTPERRRRRSPSYRSMSPRRN